ncbi:MAG: O-antigen ligase family protein [Hymenobacter sp.]
MAFHQSKEYSWHLVQNDLCKLTLAWFILNVLELGNPAGASPVGWFYEMRGSALYWFLTVPLAFLLFNRRRDLRTFLWLIIGLSVLGTLYGVKQHLLGVDSMEQAWLDAGAYRTHVLWGQLRVFSFYSEAAQFGSSQAHIGLICLILALGPYATWKRVALACAALLLLYGMLISGTRGAMFVFVVGGFIYLALSKQVKVLIVGSLLAVAAFGVLKYTYIGNNNINIVRLRTSLNPDDPSLQVRIKNQAILREYLASRPLGGGVGSIGMWGTTYNPGKFLSTIAPDSYFVKVWAEYGIIGFLVWLGISLYILGKCCGIVWNIRDPGLRQQLLALTAGYGGILVCSYGNEIMNQMPSATIIYISWVFVFLGPKLDQPKQLSVSYV